MLTPEIIRQISIHVLESSDLTKKQVLEIWDLDESDYEDLQGEMLRIPGIALGPRRIGGFRARLSRSKSDSGEGATENILLAEDWEQNAVTRLVEVLSHQDLEDLQGSVKQSLRHLLGKRRGTKDELAAALVIRHGQDLLSDKDLRERLGRACSVKPPNRWHPGKHAAIAFVRSVGLPSCLAGEPAEPRLPDITSLRGHVQFKPLADFQREVHSRLKACLRRDGGRALLTLPTGAGKTRVAVETIRDWLGDRIPDAEARDRNTVLWLAHTEELCEQAHQGFREMWEFSPLARPATLVRFWSDYTSSDDHIDELMSALDRTSILVSTPARLISLLRSGLHPELVRKLTERTELIVIDEAHRAGAPSYREILERMAVGATRVIGLTATPFCKEYAKAPEEGTRRLVEMFAELVEASNTTREMLQARKVLARPDIRVVETSMVFRMPRWAAADPLSPDQEEHLDRIMSGRADNSRRRAEILDHLLPLCRSAGSSILYFGPTVHDAETMCFMLRRQGVRAAVVSGDTRPASRRRMIESFRDGEISVLCNCQVLTTGFDAPRVSHVAIARPTVSRVLFEQMVGRGLRGPLFGGTESCEILVFRDLISGGGPQLGYEEFRELWTGKEGRKISA